MKGSDNYYIEYKLGINEILNEIILTTGGKLMFTYAESYKRNPKAFISSFIAFESIRMASCLIIFTAKKHGLLKELEGKKDFSEWVEKQDLESRWKPVLSNLILVLWGVINENNYDTSISIS